jgi:two-component system invasion response regulator UvrY
MLRILIVDDHLIVRQSLKQFVEGGPDKVTTAEVCSSQEAIKTLHENAYDVVLLGIGLSEIRSVELLKQVRADKPNLPVLILSVSDEEQYCSRLLRAGASGILSKQSASGELLDAITKLSRGRKYISPSLAESLADFSTDGNIPLPDTLSDREYEVMVSIASGKRMKQIADEISLSIKTVSTYHSRILQKLKLTNNAQLIRYAIEQGIIRDSVIAREKLILTELNIKTAPIIATVKEIWRQRKAIIIFIGIFSIIAFIFLWYAVNFLF